MNSSQGGKSIGTDLTYHRVGESDSTDLSFGDQLTLLGQQASKYESGERLGDDLEIVDLSKRYRIEGVIGQGGMGQVLLATDTRLNRKVAIKRILGESSQSKSALERFLTEAKSIAALSHPNIVQVYDYGRATDGPFLIMEYVDGGTLLDRCRDGALPIEQAIDLACQLCDGLAKAHDAGIVHRDIKPANILITNDGHPKLLDFGLAKAESTEGSLTTAGMVLGTIDFMPPEQRHDAKMVDERSDLWSLAATIYQMVTGKSPKTIWLDDVPTCLQPVLGKALKESREDRYQSARELKTALRAVVTGSEKHHPSLAKLRDGECLQCHATNEVNQKFCRNCGDALRVKCLHCKHEIPVWDNACSDCGAKQIPLIEERRKALQLARAAAEERLDESNFDAARLIAGPIAEQADSRLKEFSDWAATFLKTLSDREAAQLKRVTSLIDEAIRHEAAFDYSSAVNALLQVPGPLRNQRLTGHSPTVSELLERNQNALQECKDLEGAVRVSISHKKLDGLRSKVERLLTLRPDRSDVKKLHDQLVERDQRRAAVVADALETARNSIANLDFDAALQCLDQVIPGHLDPGLLDLRSDAERKQRRREELRKDVGNRIKSKEVVGLLPLLDELLTLEPDRHDLVELRQKLLLFEQRNAEQQRESIDQALQFRSTGQFSSALSVLSAIPRNSQCQQTVQLIEELEQLSRSQTAAIQAIDEGLRKRSYELARIPMSSYMKQLIATGIRDSRFERRYKRIQQLNPSMLAIRWIVIAGLTVAVVYVCVLLISVAMAFLSNRQQHSRNSPARQQREAPPPEVEFLLGASQAYEEQAAKLRRDIDVPGVPPNTSADPPFTPARPNLESELPGLRVQPNQNQTRASRFALETEKPSSRVPDEEITNQFEQPLDAVRDDADSELEASVDDTGEETLDESSQARIVNSVGMALRRVDPGTFVMGARDLNDAPERTVTISKPFYLGVYEVTQVQYQRVMGNNPSHFKGARNPVEMVTWEEATEFCQTLSELNEEKEAGRRYRLPTEAEWEYVCRAGSQAAFSFGDGEDELQNYSWFKTNSRNETHGTGKQKPNLWGFYDMHGNVWEWCADGYRNNPPQNDVDPFIVEEDGQRVLRGGSWDVEAKNCRAAFRLRREITSRYPDFGFRVVLSMER